MFLFYTLPPAASVHASDCQSSKNYRICDASRCRACRSITASRCAGRSSLSYTQVLQPFAQQLSRNQTLQLPSSGTNNQGKKEHNAPALPLAICSASATGSTTGSGVHIPALMREDSSKGPRPLVSQLIRTPPVVKENGQRAAMSGISGAREQNTRIRDNFDLL